MKRVEITVMVADETGLMVMTDRCVMEAENTADAARKYAALFLESE